MLRANYKIVQFFHEKDKKIYQNPFNKLYIQKMFFCF